MMKNVLMACCAAGSATAFVVPATRHGARSVLAASSITEEPKIGMVDMASITVSAPTKRGPVTSQAIPFLKCNPVLDGELAGDFGFDPLNFAQNKEALWDYREAEVKHARLAMLAAAGWPISELLDRSIAENFGVPALLDDADRVPSLLNGGLDHVVPEWWGFCLGLTAAIDSYGIQKARAAGFDSGYVPGDLGWDPLGLYPADEEGKKDMQMKEIKHGRTAMMAVAVFSIEEFSSKQGVVDETPFFFYPITETAETFLQGLVN